MNNNDEKISASEINKFCYCNYSWYYERLYGKKYIRERYKERNESLELNCKTLDNFKRGIKFHDTFLIKRKIKLIIKILLLFIIIALLLWGLKICGIL